MKKDEMNPGIHVAGDIHQYSPLNSEAESSHEEENYADVHLQGCRESQEDGGVYVQLHSAVELSPAQVAERMWTSLKNVDEQVTQLEKAQAWEKKDQGTTACIASIHQNHLITANLADSVLFAVLYSPEGNLIGASRVTQNLHKPTQKEERVRIESQGGYVLWGRVSAKLGVARALGDHCYKGVSSDASLGVYSLDEMEKTLNPDGQPVGKMQFIMTCDGFTEPTERKLGHLEHHDYLKRCLAAINNGQPGNLSESMLAKALAEQAIADGSEDNVSVSVMTNDPQNTNTKYFAIFDGHGGQHAVNAVVQNFAKTFNQQLAMAEAVYQQQPQSAQNKQVEFSRDNDAIFKMLPAGIVQQAPAVQSQTTTTTVVSPATQSQATTTTTSVPAKDILEKRKAIENKAEILLGDGQATMLIFKNKNFVPNNPEHNKVQELERVQYVFPSRERQLAFKTLIEKKGGSVHFCGAGNVHPFIVELRPDVVDSCFVEAKKESVATRKDIEQKAHTIQGFSTATKVIFKNRHFIHGNPEHNEKQPLELVQFVFANQEEQEQFKTLVEQQSQTNVAYCGKANLNPYVVELLPQVVATLDIAAFQPVNVPAQMDAADKVEQAPAQKKGIADSPAELQNLMKLLNLSDEFTLGEAIDDGGCFFDSLAQTLNQLQGTDSYSENSLRLLCQNYFFANKEEVNTWNMEDGGLELGDDYAFVKYTKAQLDVDFYGRAPIWGRPSVEGKILCRELNLEALYVVELIIDPENGSLIPAVYKATKDGYIQQDNLPRDAMGKAPVLLVHQGKLHFVPLLSQVKPAHEKDKDKDKGKEKELPENPVVQTKTKTKTTFVSQKMDSALEISRHPTDSKKVLVKASVTPKFERKPQHVVFVLDRSGSMDQNGAIELVKEATKQLVREALNPDDRFSVIVYDKTADVLVPTTKQSEAKAALEKISQLSTGGGTEIQKGLALIGKGGTYPVQVDDVANTSIILLTDGDNGTKITPENEIEGLKQRLNSTKAPVIVPIGVGRSYKPKFLAGFGQLTGLDTVIHISDGKTMAAGFNTAAKFISPHLSETAELTLKMTADTQLVSEQTQNIGQVYLNEPGTYIFELDRMPNEVNLALSTNVDNQQLSTTQNLAEIETVNRDIVALYANQLLLKKGSEVDFSPWETREQRKKEKALELERDVLSLLTPAYPSDSGLVKRVRSNLITIIKSLYGILEDDNQAKAAKSDTTVTQVSSTAIAEFVKFGLTGLDNYNAQLQCLSLNGKDFRLTGSDADYVKCQNRYLISFSAAFNKSQAVLIDQESPVLQDKLKTLKTAINGKITIQGKLETVAEQVKGIFTNSKINYYLEEEGSFKLGGNTIYCVPFEQYIENGIGESRHQALLSGQFVADLVRKNYLKDGSVRQFFGLSEDGKAAHSWVGYHPRGSNSLFIIDPSNQPAVYDLSSPEDVVKARKDYAARGLSGVLDGFLASYKRLKLEDQEPISDNLLGSIADEQVFNDKGYIDPISLEVMAKPVRIEGEPKQQVFDEASIKAWFASCGAKPINPLTRQPCSTVLVPAIDVRDKIIFEIQAQNNAIPSERLIDMYDNRQQQRAQALADGLYALNYALVNEISYSADDLIPEISSDTTVQKLSLFTKPDLAAIYTKFNGVRSCIGAASMMLANPGMEIPGTENLAFVQLVRSDSGEVQLQLSFKDEKGAVGLLNLLNDQEFEGVAIDSASINHPEYGLFNATVVIKEKEIRSYLEDLLGMPKHNTAFLFRICNLGGHYCQQYLDSAKLDALEAVLTGFQKSKEKGEGFFDKIGSNFQAFFQAPPTVSAEEQADIAKALLSIIHQVRQNEGTAIYEHSGSKPILQLLKPASNLKDAIKEYMDLVILLASSSQYVPSNAPALVAKA